MPHNRKLTAAEGGRNVAGRDATRYEKRVEWNEDRIRWWLKEGNAQPTTRVVFLLEKVRSLSLSLVLLVLNLDFFLFLLLTLFFFSFET